VAQERTVNSIPIGFSEFDLALSAFSVRLHAVLNKTV